MVIRRRVFSPNCVSLKGKIMRFIFRVAIVQHKSTADHKENLRYGLAALEEAKKNGAALVLFPECFLTTYGCPDALKSLPPIEEAQQLPSFRQWYQAALTENSEEILAFRKAAEALSIGVIITSFTRGKHRPRNTAFLIGKDGNILLEYHKVHTCDFDWERYLEGGSGFFVCEFEGISLGVMICYDREYPESARELMLQGAEIILVPNDCDNMRPRLRELSVRAMENMVGIAMANPPGKDAGNSCAFHPMVWDQPDNAITVATETFDGLVYADFDMDAIRAFRAAEDLGKERKVQAYRHLLGKRTC